MSEELSFWLILYVVNIKKEKKKHGRHNSTQPEQKPPFLSFLFSNIERRGRGITVTARVGVMGVSDTLGKQRTRRYPLSFLDGGVNTAWL